MSEQNIGQILQAFNSIESRLKEQTGLLHDLTMKVNALEAENKQLIQLVHKLQTTPQNDASGPGRKEFQENVTKSLRSLEDKSKKAIELIKANGKGKARAWP